MLRRNELVSAVKDIIYTHYLKAKPLEPSVLAKEIVETILRMQQGPKDNLEQCLKNGAKI